MKRICLLAFLIIALPVLAQPNTRRLLAYETAPGTLGEPCDFRRYPNVYLIKSNNEFWECPQATEVWTQITVESPSVPSAHATTHMTGGTNTDPVAGYTQSWTRGHTFSPSADETAVGINTATSGTAVPFYVDDNADARKVEVDATGRTTLGGAQYLAQLTVEGTQWLPTSASETLEFWYESEDVALSCGSSTTGTSITSVNDWPDKTGNTTITPVPNASDYPELWCGPCCGDGNCTTQWMENGGGEDSNCNVFTQATASNFGQVVATELLEGFTLSPTITVGGSLAADGIDQWTIVSLVYKLAYQAGRIQWFGDTVGGGTEYLDIWSNRGPDAEGCGTSTTQGTAAATGCSSTNMGTPLSGDCTTIANCSPDCSDDSNGTSQGIGDFYVVSVQLEAEDTTGSDGVSDIIRITELRVNGTSRLASPITFQTCSDEEFTIDSVMGELGLWVGIFGYNAKLSTAELSTAENYWSAKYGLGDSMDFDAGALDDTETRESAFVATTSKDPSKPVFEVDPSGTVYIAKNENTISPETLVVCFDINRTKCVNLTLDTDGDFKITTDELTIGDGAAEDISLVFDTDGTESIFWDDSESGFTPSQKFTYAAGAKTLIEDRAFPTPFTITTSTNQGFQMYTFQFPITGPDGAGGVETKFGANLAGDRLDIDFNITDIGGFLGLTADENVTVGTGGQGTGSLLNSVNVVTTANSGDDVSLSTITLDFPVVIVNDSGNSIDVYPPVGDAIGDNPTNNPVGLADNSIMTCWHVVGSNVFCHTHLFD